MTPEQAKALGLKAAPEARAPTPEEDEATMAELEEFFITPASTAASVILSGVSVF